MSATYYKLPIGAITQTRAMACTDYCEGESRKTLGNSEVVRDIALEYHLPTSEVG